MSLENFLDESVTHTQPSRPRKNSQLVQLHKIISQDDEAVRRLDEQLAKYMKLREMYQHKRSKATCDPRSLDIKAIIDKLISLRRMGPHISTSIQKHIAAKEAKASEEKTIA